MSEPPPDADPAVVPPASTAPDGPEGNDDAPCAAEKVEAEDNGDAASVKTTITELFHVEEEPAPPDEPQRSPGLNVILGKGWSGSFYDDYEYVSATRAAGRKMDLSS